MKFIVAGLVAITSADPVRAPRFDYDALLENDDYVETERGYGGDRKMKQLVVQLDNYHPGQSSSEWEYRIRGYGCNCHVGDIDDIFHNAAGNIHNKAPMKTKSYGKPVNFLDASCRAYQECIKCAMEEHGDKCFEYDDWWGYGYKYDIVDQEVQCLNKPKTCRRSICECDKMFAKMQADHFDEYDESLSLLGGFEPQDQCVRTGGKGNPGCCGGDGNPFYVYNKNVKECCANGTVALQGNCPVVTTTPKPTTTTTSTSTTTTTTTTISTTTTTPTVKLTTFPVFSTLPEATTGEAEPTTEPPFIPGYGKK